MARGLNAIGCACLGATLMYFLDPDRGKRRRSLMRDRGIHTMHLIRRGLGKSQRDLAHRSKGLVAEAQSHFHDGTAPDAVLQGRVRTKMGRVVSHPHAIEIAADDGIVTLSGPILADEVDRVLKCTAAVPGVKHVENRLEPHEQGEHISALQGGSRRPGERMEFMQENWAPAARLVAIVGGGGLLIYSIGRRGITGSVAGLLGLGLVLRGAANVELRRLIGLSGARRVIDIQKTILVNAPLEDVYEVWSHVESFPHFMAHVREVRQTAPEQSHWTVCGPAGMSIEWDAVTTRQIPNELLAWKSLPGALVEHEGTARFERTAANGTRLDLKLSYNPPAGALGHVVAALFGIDPKHVLDDDLVRFKSLIELGKTRGAHGERVTRDELLSTLAAGAGTPS